MSHLLDSLLSGYPIGSLLVCRVRGDAHVLEETSGTRRAVTAAAGTWQLLDGQQQVIAIGPGATRTVVAPAERGCSALVGGGIHMDRIGGA